MNHLTTFCLGSFWQPSVNDEINILKLKISEAEINKIFHYAVSSYDQESNTITDSDLENSKKVITFSSVLNHGTFPLAPILKELLEIGQKEMNNPIEIEFAVDLENMPGRARNFLLSSNKADRGKRPKYFNRY